jgi:hypothetical protein
VTDAPNGGGWNPDSLILAALERIERKLDAVLKPPSDIPAQLAAQGWRREPPFQQAMQDADAARNIEARKTAKHVIANQPEPEQLDMVVWIREREEDGA